LIPKSLRLENYIDATNAIPFWQYLWNSTYYTIFATIGAVLSNTFIAYGFARVRWRGRNVLFIIVIATMMLPFQVRMIPLYILFARIGWLNSFLPLIVPNFFGNAFYIFLMRQFMMTLPKELDDAARIDGASEWGIFWRVAVPLSKPAILTVAIFEIIHTWHDFIGPLVYLRHPTKYTLSIGLRLYFTQYGAEWGLLMAAAAMFTIPMVIFFFFAQRSFIEGITLTGLKG
jgi:multiple sugar transport system permease protein